ncbi:Sensor protein evgS [Fibrisoma limi BUZ 3]|uniref:histidine kinase n=1 Tax=Fibrisoma limi BUZ 3 TaxID=1185876 RepID=I2GFH3_9BACT|nr:two-component regulator propeller domain-containing protein [Fibrisoma limi]CCH52648.1 Sensor protein evgS [Fibrisoma limi BUZ 3]
MYRRIRHFFYLQLLVLVGLVTQVWAFSHQPEYLTVRNGLPQGFVKSMLQDQRGFIWLATRDGLCRHDGLRFKIYRHDPEDIRSLSFSSILEIKEDSRGRIWVLTENNHVDCFNPVTEQTVRVSNSTAFRQAIGRDILVSIAPDQQGNVWVATQMNGFFRLSPDGSVQHHHWTAVNDSVQHVLQTILPDRQGHLWLATTDGLHRFNLSSGQSTAYGTEHGLPQPRVWNVHQRANGELMLAFPNQFAIFDPNQGKVRRRVTLPDGQAGQIPVFTTDYRGRDFVNQHPFSDQNGLTIVPADPKFRQYSPLSVLVDHSNVLWIGTSGDGVVKYDLNKQPFNGRPYVMNFHVDWMTQQFGVPAASIPAVIRNEWSFSLRYLFDNKKNLWVAGAKTPPYRYDPVTRQFTLVQPTGIPAHWINDGSFRLTALAKGQQGEMWGLLGPDQRVVVRYNTEHNRFTAFPLPLPANHPYQIVAMAVDGGRIYLATQQHGLLRADLSTNRLIHWSSIPNETNSLPVNDLLCLAQPPSQHNTLWIGTYGNGLCRLDKLTGKIQRFTDRNGLPNNVIYAIQPDGQGHLWLSTNRGLCWFNINTYEVRSYTSDDGLPGDEFNRFHDVMLPDGRVVFGGVNGYTVFNPHRVREDGFKPVVALTALRINNQAVNANDPESPIRESINEVKELILDYRQNFLSFDFAALQFNHSAKNQYRYKLVGLDEDWVYSGTQATATYTNLSPGTYNLVVNTSNTSGIWSPHLHQIRIVIEPPIWATWWAYVCYALMLLGAVAWFVRVRVKRVQMRHRMELREQESLQLKALDEIKSRFFSNITHEFRTPLTLILAPLEELLREITAPQQHSRLSTAYRNASQLLRLINQLLDLAKLEAGSLPVKLSQGDLVGFVEQCVSSFADEADRRQIQLRVQHQTMHRFYWFDTEKLEKIVNNLVANSLKFTGQHGSVDVSITSRLLSERASTAEDETPDSLIRLTVTDTGVGIARHKLPHIFDRFYQADQTANRSAAGTGIGLALAKELVDAMQGTISVESRPGQGTTFTVELPCRLARSTSVVDEPLVQPLPVRLSVQPLVAPTAVPSNPDPAHILLVEDNDDIAAYVTSLLSTDWHITRASNGQAGIELALTDSPDLIISDVLMPELSGYDVCRSLKENPLTSHIPIILLTARASTDSRVEGFTAGADDYLAKPFSVEELRWRIRNRLEQQRRLRMHYRTQLLREGNIPPQAPQPSVDDDFLNKIYSTLEAHLDDSTFGVEPLAESVSMSRMHLHRKLKALTGMSANELIRAVRLNRAAELLLTNVPVSEVAYQVGFEAPAYFSRVFKEQYGLTPTEFAEQSRLKSA